jgi:hypothetical protein
VAEDKNEREQTLVEKWLEDQQEWQRTALSYLDSLVKNEEFLTHLGNAMRGSLLGGRAYPTAFGAEAGSSESPADERLDEILFAIHEIRGQIHDLQMSVDKLVAQGQPNKAKQQPRTRRKAAPSKRGDHG